MNELIKPARSAVSKNLCADFFFGGVSREILKTRLI